MPAIRHHHVEIDGLKVFAARTVTSGSCAMRVPVPLSFRWASPATNTTSVLPIPSAGGASTKAKPRPAGDA